MRLKVGWGERGAGRFTHDLLLITWEMVGQSRTTSAKAKRGVGWTMNNPRGAERFTHAQLFFIRGSR
jgi:hypothetical protein